MKKNRIFVIILIIVVTASVVLISGYFKKAVCENNPDSEVFGIYTATLDGKNMKPLITNSWQRMSHARVSPDKKWVTFTRYTNRGKDGYATENEANYERGGEQYLGTEVLIMRIDGTDVRTLIPHQKDRFAANSYWTPDGKGIIYVSGPNEKGRPQINHIIFDDNIQVKEITKLPIPGHILPSDPHWVGDWIVFPAIEPVSKARGIWRIKYNGEGLQQLTWPKIKIPFGDNDPKLSPDGSKVAFIRRVKEGPFFHVVVVDINTKEERDFSSGYLPEEARAAADLPPEWSSGGKLLIFSHMLVDGKKALSQMHTIKPDGTGRKRVPLPRNYAYFHTSFFPGEGSGNDTRIIFSTKKIASSGKKQPPLKAAVSGAYKKNKIISETSHGEVFGIYTATLGGKNMKPLITNSWQQMSHARVSPDKKWVTFTRYNNRGKDGYATENQANYDRKGEQYLGTEILVMRIDGTDVRILIPHQKDRIAGNSYWTPDGKGIIYVSSPNEKGRPQINFIILDDNIQVKEITKIPIPEHIIPTDPHWVGEWVVFPAMDIKNRKMGIWRMRYDGSGLELLAETPKRAEMQDNDPKLSPDASKVAFMRKMKQRDIWHTLVVDVETKQLNDLSKKCIPKDAKVALEAVPSWSSDGRLLIFDRIILYNSGKWLNEIHTMRPDGSRRRKAPFSRKYLYFHPSFFPGEGSDKEARIIFSTRKMGASGKKPPTKETTASGSYERINIVGETAKNGVYDLSIEYDEKGTGWVAYTAMDWVGTTRYLHTHLAKTTDHGKTWTYVKRINAGKDDSITLRDGTEVEGIWRPEVPTLVYDPNDPGKEWKLFWHKYFCKFPCSKREDRKPGYGWIAYKYAPDPAGPWSEEVALFGGIAPLPPFKVETNLNELHPDLKNVVAYTEPGSLVKDGVLYLSLQAIEDAGKKLSHFKTILISSHDHGKSWKYVGTLTDYKDAAGLGAGTLTASSLAQEKGRAFLLISPTKTTVPHQGTYIFEFEDISKAKLKRDKRGKLIVHKYFKPSIKGDAGESDYDEQNTYGGVTICQIAPEFDPVFGRIFNTKEMIIDEGSKKPPTKKQPFTVKKAGGPYERINIIGETANRGVFDPALEYNEDGSIGWMVYSALEQPPEKVNRPFPKYIHTHLVKTLDNGRTWKFIKCLNESKEDRVVIEDSIDPRIVKIAKLNNGRIKGTWRHEVATLVHDPDDPGKEWKLFWHKYFSIENPEGGKRLRVMEYSWIMYKCASTPEMLDTAQSVELFGTDITLTRARYNINRMPGLEDSLYCSEPGSLYKDGVLYLSFDSGRMKHDSHKQVLLSSKDHGRTWTYISKLTDYSDAKSLPRIEDTACAALLASTLAEDRGRLFLLSSRATSRGHRGTYFFEFEDITKGKLKRDKTGKLIVHKFLPPSILLPKNNAGESDYDEHNTYGGVIMPQGDPSSFPRLGQIFNTKEVIIGEGSKKPPTKKQPFTVKKAGGPYERINIIGETAKNGVADPSIEYDRNGVGWMTYSGVKRIKRFGYVSTHLAKSIDHGKTWTYVSTINPSAKDTIYPILPVMIKKYGKKIEGTWFHEVSTLVHDPNDPGKEWKLFWHRYFMKPKLGAAGRVLHYGWVAYKYASDPAGKWSEEIPLFGAGPLPLKPYKARINLNELHPDLSEFITYTELGSLMKDDVLYLTLQGHIIKRHIVKGRENIAHIILIASHDHGKTWRYVDTLLRNEDAQDFGGNYFTASSLVEEGGRAFLFASPENDEDIKIAHRGTVIFEFEDIARGQLKRDKNGELIVRKWLKPTLSRGGQSDYDEQNTYGGIVMPGVDVVNPKIKKRFQIFNTKEGIIWRKQLK